MISALFAALVLAQDPSPPAPGERLDQVVLRNGEVIEGRIRRQFGNYLEIEPMPGGMVGFRMAEVAEVRRAAGAEARATAFAPLPPRDEWFALHDGRGQAVGWLHSATTAEPGGGARLAEEWEFRDGRRHFQVTMLETVDAQARPVSCYFRERVGEELVGMAATDPQARRDRVLSERIVEASVRGDGLHIERLRPEGRDERTLPWAPSHSFPLLLRQRQRLPGARGLSAVVFDPATEELALRTWSAPRRRTVAIDGKVVPVTEVTESAVVGANVLWSDASGGALRREIAGPTLVALPATAEAAQGAVQRRASTPAAFVAEAGGRFGLWVPNPAWEAAEPTEGAVALQCALHRAAIVLTEVAHLDPAATLSTAADQAERWLRLVQPALRIDARRPIDVRGRSAMRIEASGRTAAGDEAVVLVVVPWCERFLLLRCAAARASFAELEPDFAAVIARLELEPPAVAQLLPKDPSGHAVAAAAVARRSAGSAPAPASASVALPAFAPASTAPSTSAPAPMPAPDAKPRTQVQVRLPVGGN